MSGPSSLASGPIHQPFVFSEADHEDTNHQDNPRRGRSRSASAPFSRALAQQVECGSQVTNIKAVTNPAGHVIKTRYQFDQPNLQPLLATTIASEGGCLVAHLSGQVRITDNYVAFQVRVDGVPLQGQLPLPLYTTPVVFVAIDSATVNQDEQFIDPSKVVGTTSSPGSQRYASGRSAGRRRQRTSIPQTVQRRRISCSHWNIAECLCPHRSQMDPLYAAASRLDRRSLNRAHCTSAAILVPPCGLAASGACPTHGREGQQGSPDGVALRRLDHHRLRLSEV